MPSPPARSTTVQQHVLTRAASGERIIRPFLVDTSYALLSGDFDEAAWAQLEAPAQSRWIYLIDRVHAAEVAMAQLDAHVRLWAEQAMVTTGSIEDLPGTLRRAIRIAVVREDARLAATENASDNFARDGVSADRVTPHKIVGLASIASRIGVDQYMWDPLGVAWCETYDLYYAERIGELMEVARG